MIAATEDTNLIARSDLQTQQQIAVDIRRLLETDPYPDEKTLQRLNEHFVERNLSPGGSADLLAATWFLHFWNTKE